jgi:predicted DNA-binding protein
MSARTASINYHLPLSPELHEQLREEADRSGQPATSLAREALQSTLAERRKKRLHAEIAEFAFAHGGTDIDLDKDLEHAGITQRLGALSAADLRAVEAAIRAAIDLDS